MVGALAITGSPREGNTRAAVADLLDALAAGGLAGEEVSLSEAAVEPIGDCRACVERGGCTIEDGFAALMERVEVAELLVLGSPLYWYGVSGQLKLFLDRWSCLLDLNDERFRARMRGKRTVVVLAQGERGFYEAGPCLQMLEWTLRYMEMPLAGRIVVVGHARGDYAADEPQRVAVRLAAAELLAGRQADVQPPWFHLRHAPAGPLGGIFGA